MVAGWMKTNRLSSTLAVETHGREMKLNNESKLSKSTLKNSNYELIYHYTAYASSIYTALENCINTVDIDDLPRLCFKQKQPNVSR